MTARHAATPPCSRCQPVPGYPRAEQFTPPSRAHDRLLRHSAWLVSPANGQGPQLGRFLHIVTVAPMTQLTEG